MPNDNRILDELLKLTSSVSELSGKVDRLDDRLAEQGRSLITLTDGYAKVDRQVETLDVRMQQFGDRLQTTESLAVVHGHWRSRLTGVWVGATAAIAFLGAMAALLWNFFRGR